MKTIGILGGVGPQTTSKVYLSIIDAFKKSGAKEYPPILIYNLPFPFQIEEEVIIQGINSEKMIPYLIEGSKILEKSGADFGILPCNTLHKYIEDIRNSVKIPFLSILEETAKQLKSINADKIGILATETTVNDKLYDDVLGKNNIQTIYPTDEEQAIVNKIIVEILSESDNAQQDEQIKKVCASLQARGAKAILLACTDLQIIMAHIEIDLPVLDTTDILIQASIREMMNK